MRSSPGFLNVIQGQLEELPLEILESINKLGGLEVRDLLDFLVNPKDYTVDQPYQVDPNVVVKNTNLSINSFWIGKDSLISGETAHCIIANEDAFGSIPSDASVTLLESQLMKVSWVKHVWILTPPDKVDDVKRLATGVGKTVKIIENYQSFSLTPDNRLHIENGTPLTHACGSGDLLNALRYSNILNSFISEGGKYIIACMGNNILGGGRPVLVGQHIISQKPVTAEVTLRKSDDKQSILCEHAGFNQLIEKSRFSTQTNIEEFFLMSTGTYVFDATLEFSDIKWKWHRIKKIQNSHIVVQYIRTLCDLTASFQTQFIETQRHYCYMTLKDYRSTK
jgi:hypothetical protein